MATSPSSPNYVSWLERMYDAYSVNSTATLEAALTTEIDTLKTDHDALVAMLPALLATLQTAREDWAAHSIPVGTLLAAEGAVGTANAAIAQKRDAMQRLISQRSTITSVSVAGG